MWLPQFTADAQWIVVVAEESSVARPPFKIGDFVGQREVLAPILRQLDGAISRGEPLTQPLAFVGESGLGKSLAARSLAGYARADIFAFHGTTNADAIVEVLRRAKRCDFVFFDETHQLHRDAQ